MNPVSVVTPFDPDPDDRARLARYRRALAFYEGDQWPDRPRRGETRLTVNYARAIVRKVASYVFPAPVTFSVTPPVSDPEGEALARQVELLLADVVADLDLGQLDLQLAVSSAVLGDAAIKVTWNAAARGGRGAPVVAAVDPATLRAWWAPDDPRRLRRLTQTYALPGLVITEMFGTPDPLALEPDQPYPVVEDWTERRWSVTVAGQLVRDEPNPYGWIPYVILPNSPRPHRFWGESDLEDLYDICQELNRRLSVLAHILDVSGAPIAVLENVDGSDGIAVGPGAKWELPEGARAYLLDLLGGGGVGLHVEYINLLYRSLHDLAEAPRTAFGDAGRDLSGVALEVEIQPLVQQVNRKRRGWEMLFRRRNARLLDLLERFGHAEVHGLRRTETIWPAVLPSDTSVLAQNQVRLVQAGIRSRRTAISELGGNDPDGEWRRIREEFAAPPAS